MPGADVLLIVGFCLVLVIPFVLYCVGQYEAPHSMREAVKGAVTFTGSALLTFAALNVFWNHLDFERWSWNLAAGFVVGGFGRFFVDWLALRRRQGKNEL